MAAVNNILHWISQMLSYSFCKLVMFDGEFVWCFTCVWKLECWDLRGLKKVQLQSSWKVICFQEVFKAKGRYWKWLGSKGHGGCVLWGHIEVTAAWPSFCWPVKYGPSNGLRRTWVFIACSSCLYMWFSACVEVSVLWKFMRQFDLCWNLRVTMC